MFLILGYLYKSSKPTYLFLTQQTMNLKSLLLAGLLTLCMGIVSAQQWMSITSDQPAPAKVELIEDGMSNSSFSVKLEGFMMNPVITPRGEAFTISVDECSPMLEKGMPDLPKITASLAIPADANMEISIVSSKFREFTNVEIAPSKGNLYRDIDPESIPYVYGPAYQVNAFYPRMQASLREPYIIRDYRGQTAVITPFTYNPVTKVLRVYYDITVNVKQDGRSAINVLPENSTGKALSQDFKNIYERHFLNTPSHDRYTPLEEHGNMLIICYGTFMTAMQPFIDWKTTIGVPVEMVDVATIGANATAIKNYVSEYYADNGLTYLLLVGDNAQVPTVTTGDLGGPSDHAYGYLVGNDHYPDILVGRFSAENADQVSVQVERTVSYEQTPVTTADWFSKGFGIASDQGPGDDNEYDYEHMQNIRTDLLGFTYTYVGELYDGTQGGLDEPGNPGPTNVATQVNEGRSIINYVGHGSDVSWGTTGFSNSNVNQLVNNDKWPFIISVACVNGNFLSQTCFAEAWLRANNTNGPTGAIAAMMSTINQSWNPPMDGQDEMNDILIEAYPNNIKRTFGGVSINGCLKMNDTYGSAGWEMTDTWLIFGDPSVMLRTAMPANLTAIHEDIAFIGSNQFTVTCGVDGAFAALTMNGEILGSAYVVGGTAVINIPELSEVGMMTLAITAFNYLPYLTEIQVVPLDGAYITYNNTVVNDVNGNNNQQLDYGESTTLSIGFKNAGTEDAQNVTINISTSDPFITLTDSTELYPLMVAGQVATMPDGYAISVANDIPEGHHIVFEYVATAATNTWDGSFELIAHAAVLNFAGITINDQQGNNNGRLDAGETVYLNLNILNAGTAPAYNVNGMLSTEDPYLLVNVDSVYYGTLDSYQSLPGSFMVTALPDCPSGHTVDLTFLMSADFDIASQATPCVTVGQIPVLIIDMDGNHNSGPAIQESLNNIGVSSNYVTSWPLAIGPYQSVFVCLGTYDQNYVLTSGQGNALANFMNNQQGKVYMEGGDTWAYNTPTAAHPMFKIDGSSDGSGDLSTIAGVAGTITDGMTFIYDGDNSYIDHLEPLESAISILANQSPAYTTAVAYDGGTYRTIGSSHEFGGLMDGRSVSDRDSLMSSYIGFFGLSTQNALLANFLTNDTEVCKNSVVHFEDYSAGNVISWNWSFPGGVPDTSRLQNPDVTYPTSGIYDVILTVSDGIGTYTTTKTQYMTIQECTDVDDIRLSNISLYPNPTKGYFSLTMPENTGRTEITVYTASGVEAAKAVASGNFYKMDVTGLPTGLYFVRVSTDSSSETIKLVITR